MSESILKWALGIVGSLILSLGGWVYNQGANIAVLENKIQNLEHQILKDDNSKQTANDVLKDWSSFKSTQESQGRQLKNLWEHLNEAQRKELHYENRISRLETKQEICCE